MAPPPTPTTTYMAIPPPPLPEFYMETEAQSAASGSSTSKAEDILLRQKLPAIPGDGADDRWKFTKINKTTSKALATPPEDSDEAFPPLAVYHICRICLRPRSARYHREHPIPVDGLPPPPGICRRCRVSTVHELRNVTDVMEEEESSDVKLGIKAFVPDEDCFTNEEMRAKRARRILTDTTWMELEPASDRKATTYRSSNLSALKPKSPPPIPERVVYRHVHVTVPAPPPRSPPRPAVHTASTAQDAIHAVSAEASDPAPKYGTYWIPPPPPPQIRSRPAVQPTEAEPSVSSHASTSTKSKHRSSSHHASVSIHTTGRERSESEIRRLARDEVERYRRAERRIEAHRDPYAHGRMVEAGRVPVERRIALEVDAVGPTPWDITHEISRTDSGIANFKSAPKIAEKEKEIVVGRSRTADGGARLATTFTSQTARSLNSPPSSVSSDKTRWPSAEQQASVGDRIRIDDGNRSSHRTYVVAERVSAGDAVHGMSRGPKYEVAEVKGERRPQSDRRDMSVRYVPDKKAPELPDRIAELREYSERQERAEAWSKETQKAFSGTQTSKCSERAYSNDNPARTDANHVSAQKMEHSLQRGGEFYGKQVEVEKRRVETTLPYPREDLGTAVSMPSPSSHVSRPTRAPVGDGERPGKRNDGEYIYMERKVQTVGRSPKSRPGYDEYEEVERYRHRTNPQAEQAGGRGGATARIRDEDSKRRPSDASSRVRFSKKVEISPTPPGSDASSSQFRNFSQIKNQGPETENGADLIAEYERRGRQRSREPTAEPEYYRERRERREPEMDRDPTPRPGPRQQLRRSGSTDTAEVPSHLGHLARCFSESPSRERLDEAARRQQRDDGLGPYAVHEKRSASVDVEDGSSTQAKAKKKKREKSTLLTDTGEVLIKTAEEVMKHMF